MFKINAGSQDGNYITFEILMLSFPLSIGILFRSNTKFMLVVLYCLVLRNAILSNAS